MSPAPIVLVARALPRAGRAHDRSYLDEIDDIAAAVPRRGTHRDPDVPTGGSDAHITWVRSPEPVVEMVESWWAGRTG